MNIHYISSPHYSERTVPISLIVIHYTAVNSVQEAIEIWTDPSSELSAHYLIGKEGTLYQHVPDEKRAWHAGRDSYWQGVPLVNNYSLGIELDNTGQEAFTSIQIERLLNLLKILCEKYSIPQYRIVGHSDVAPQRKTDPGSLFPWEFLSQQGYGVWPLLNLIPQDQHLCDILNVQKALVDIGYNCPLTGVYDKETENVVRAFKLHFLPGEDTTEEFLYRRIWQIRQEMVSKIHTPSS